MAFMLLGFITWGMTAVAVIGFITVIGIGLKTLVTKEL